MISPSVPVRSQRLIAAVWVAAAGCRRAPVASGRAILRRWNCKSMAMSSPFSSKPFHIGGVKSDGSTLRFYEKVNVVPIDAESTNHSYAVEIDNRLVQTLQKKILVLPTRALALAVAGEWALQTERIVPTSMPLTALSTSAIDQFSDKEQRQNCLSKVKAHLRADAVCFRVDSPEALVAKQVSRWDPLVEWIKDEFNAPLRTTTDLVADQPEESITNLYHVLANTDPWRLAAIDAVACVARSYVIGLAVERGVISAKQALEAARTDEEYQIENWGLVEGGHDIDKAFASLKMSSVATFLKLLDTTSST